MSGTRRDFLRGRSGIALLAATLVGCAHNDPYHPEPPGAGVCLASPASAECLRSYYQEFASHDVAFVEFSERGNAFDDARVDDVVQRIRRKADGGGAVVVAFVHGWKHNASEEDGNVRSFKAVLDTMARLLDARYAEAMGKRRLIGVYVGWRGASIDVPVLEQLTFWDRKAVAEELGSGGVTRLLLELEGATADDPRNVFVVVGHSFGGAIVVRALADVLTERISNATDGGARIFGDGVLVLNPAIEANQVLPLVEAARARSHVADQLPIFISLSTDADGATHRAFPLGQTIGLLTWRQHDLTRSYFYDRQAPEVSIPLRERHLDATTAGNFAPFLTHRLAARAEGEDIRFELTPCAVNPAGCEPKGWTTLRGQPAIRGLPAHYPLYFLKTDETVMDGHNDIFTREVRSFVFAVIDDVVRKALPAMAAPRGARRLATPSLLADPALFEARMKTIWANMPADGEE
ncbi:hypothetical protein [Thauera phenolivorans]|nr:hypothetical protein [Thauera phenolivorans]